MIYVTYATSRAGGSVEWGFTFRREDSDDAEFDLVLGERAMDKDLRVVMAKSFAANEWAAKAICAAAEVSP